MKMPSWINYHHLYYFKTIADEKSMSKAAIKLRLGQPTLSAQLKTFEESMGVKLFHRQNRRLILTDQGSLAYEYATQIFKLGNEMLEVLHDVVAPSRTNLQIGALDDVGKDIILQLVKAAYRIGPCHISLIEGKLDSLMRELAAHRLDLVVTNHLPSAEAVKGTHHRSIAKVPVAVYGAPRFKALKKGFPQSIKGQKFILPTYDSKLRLDFEHWCQLHEIHVDIIAETQDIALKKLMAIDGLGLIPAPKNSVHLQVQSHQLVEIGPLEGISDELLLMTAQRQIPNMIARQLIQSFKN